MGGEFRDADGGVRWVRVLLRVEMGKVWIKVERTGPEICCDSGSGLRVRGSRDDGFGYGVLEERERY